MDANVLVYATIPEAPNHAHARRAIQTLETTGPPLWISRQVLREFLAVLTRPQTFTLPVSVSTLAATVQAFQRRFSVAEDSA